MANADDVSDKTGKAKEKRWSGKYCCLPQCTKSNGTGHQLYQVPSGKNRRLGLDTAEWANEFHKVIFKYRYDAIFSKQVKAGKKFICNIHFEKSDIQVSSHKSWLKHGVVPTKNLPEKLFATPAPSTRRKIEKHPLPEKNKTFQYANIENIVKAFNSIVLKKWRYHKIDSKKLHFLLFRDPILHACPAISLLISQKEDSSYELSCAFGGAYTNHISEQLSLENMGISAILRHLASFMICDGYSEVADQSEWIRRTLYEATPAGVIKQERLFSTECEVTTTNKTASSVCNACMRLHVRQENSERRRASRLEKVRDIPLSKHCVLQNASKERLEASLALNRKRVVELETHLQNSGVELSSEMASVVDEVAKSDSFLKEWWDVQKQLRLTKSKFRRRYPPSVVRYCLSLYAKSPSAYRFVEKVMVLPSKKTLAIKRNEYFGSCNYGFQTKFAEKVANAVEESANDADKLMVLALDEMSIKEELVYRSSTSDIIGYVDFENETYNTLSTSSDKIASHMLAIYVRGVTNKKLDGVIAFYPTANIDSSELFFLLTDLLIEIPHQTSGIIVGIV